MIFPSDISLATLGNNSSSDNASKNILSSFSFTTLTISNNFSDGPKNGVVFTFLSFVI